MTAADMISEYKPIALYYHDADSVEYVRADVPSVSRRIDAFLTLILDMEDRNKVIGFRLKGFRNFYSKHFQLINETLNDEFLALVSVIEKRVTEIANNHFDKAEAAPRLEAYKRAREIAASDSVILRDRIAA